MERIESMKYKEVMCSNSAKEKQDVVHEDKVGDSKVGKSHSRTAFSPNNE